MRGDAGVGKSSLLDAALAEADRLGARVLHARFSDLDRHVPYAGLRAALLPSLRDEQDPEVDAAAAAVRAALELHEDTATPDPQARLAAAFEHGRRVLAHWARERMVVLALDDLHAADPDSLRVIGLLVAHLDGSRFTLLATLRPPSAGEQPELAALVERLEREGLAQVVQLVELDLADTRAVVHGLLGARPSDEVVRAVWEAAAGNAFYVTQAVAALRESNRLTETTHGYDLVDATKPITLSARATLLHRVFEMGPEARAILRLMSALDRITLGRLDLVAEVSDLEPGVVDETFDRLVEVNLLQDLGDGSFQFAHPIIKATLYEDLGPAGRRRMHQRIAEALQRERDRGAAVAVGELAAHVFHAAEPGDTDAVRVLVSAGHEASTSAPLTASEWLLRAAQLIPEATPERGEVLAVASRALFLAARVEAAAEVGSAALALLPVGPLTARTAAVVVQALASDGRFDEALSVADEQLAAVDHPLPRVQAMRATVLTYLDRFGEADDELTDALASASDDQARSVVLGAMASSAYARGDLDACFRHLDEQEALEARLGPGSRLASLVVRASYLALSGALAQARASLSAATELSDAMGGSAYRAALDTTAGIVAWLAGDWDAAVEASRKIGVDPNRAGAYGVLARIAELTVSVDRGQFARARELADEVTASRLGSSFATWAVARLDAGLGELEQARAALVKTLEADQASGRRSVEALLLGSLVDVELALEKPDRARAWAAQLEDLATGGGPLGAEVALRARAVATGDVALARAALQVAADHGLVVEHARGQAVVATLAPDVTSGAATGDGVAPGDGTATGDGGDAGGADLLTSAYETFRRVGAEPEMRRVAAAMRERGIAVPRAATRRSGSLSDTEREMARLVHEGLTNRQIARILYLSPKTVEVYLGRVFAKTGCANRLELALAVDQGRLDDVG